MAGLGESMMVVEALRSPFDFPQDEREFGAGANWGLGPRLEAWSLDL